MRPFETKAAAAYEEIRSQILSGALEPGSTVNQETLAASFGLSTTPIREALRLLESEGLVSLKAHRDMVVTPLTRGELMEVLAVRLELEPFAAGLAVKNASDNECATTLALAQSLPPTDPYAQLALNRRFHRSLYSVSGNRLLAQFLDSLSDRTDRYRLVVMRKHGDPAFVSHEHIEIAEALKNRQRRQLLTLVRSHIHSARHLLMHFDP